MPPYAPITPEKLKQIKLGTTIEIVDAELNGYTENTDIQTITDAPWQPLAQAGSVKMGTETTDDAFDYFAIAALVFTEQKNTTAKTTNFTAVCREYTELMWSIAYRNGGIPDDDGFYPMFTTNNMGKYVWVKMTKYDNNTRNKIAEQYVYCELRLDGDLEETNANIRPTLIMEVIPSAYNKQKRFHYLDGSAVPAAETP